VLAALRALLADIVDYAGLFPPARLELNEAIRNYARYRRGPESWMLARFICPAGRLGELAPYLDELFSREFRLRLSILGRGGQTRYEFLAGLTRSKRRARYLVDRRGLGRRDRRGFHYVRRAYGIVRCDQRSAVASCNLVR
jgi:hypothetical protein